MTRKFIKFVRIAGYGALVAVRAARVRELKANISQDPMDWLSAVELKAAEALYVAACKGLRTVHPSK